MSYRYHQSHKRFPGLWLVVGIALFTAALVLVAYCAIKSKSSYDQTGQYPVSASVVTPTSQAIINHSLPIRLQIKKLNVDTKIIYEGITKSGNMDVPTNVTDAGWYKYSALPGNNGTAVIAGHLDGLKGEPGVFSALSKLVPGDTITVTDTNGLETLFVVSASRTYSQSEQPKEVFDSASGSHLNLITCTGSWDSTDHRFAQRLVVFTDKSTTPNL